MGRFMTWMPVGSYFFQEEVLGNETLKETHSTVMDVIRK